MALSLFVGSVMFSLIAYTDFWYPELFIRTWGWTARETGRMNGISSVIGGPLGLLFVGWYSSRALARGQSDACLKLTAWAALGIMIPACLLPIAPSATIMAGLLIPYKFFIAFDAGADPIGHPDGCAQSPEWPSWARPSCWPRVCLASAWGRSCRPFLATLSLRVPRGCPHALSATALVRLLTFCVTWLGLKQYRQRYAEMAQDHHSGWSDRIAH